MHCQIVTTDTALSILIETTQAMLKEYRADEMTSFLKWYDKDVRLRHVALANMEIGHLTWFIEKFIQKK